MGKLISKVVEQTSRRSFLEMVGRIGLGMGAVLGSLLLPLHGQQGTCVASGFCADNRGRPVCRARPCNEICPGGGPAGTVSTCCCTRFLDQGPLGPRYQCNCVQV